jgi:hypothetical protein
MQTLTFFSKSANSLTTFILVMMLAASNFKYISHALSKIWGLPPEQVIANSSMLVKSIHPDDRSHVISNFENLLRSNRPEKFNSK